MKRRAPLRRCVRCKNNPVSWTTPRVDCCYNCLPGGPFTPPACSRCGSTRDYFTNGLCARCHRNAPQPVGSCQDCHAWGVIRKTRWLCWGCKSWRQHAIEGSCRICNATVAINPDRVCRLCRCQHIMWGGVKGGVSIEDANLDGQQLFLANLHYSPAGQSRTTRRKTEPYQVRPATFHPVEHRQLLLFDMERDLVAGREQGFNSPPLPRMARFIEQILTTHAASHGWAQNTVVTTRQGIAIVLSLQDTPGARVTATEVLRLTQIDLPARRLIEIFQAADLFDDDRIPAIHNWVTGQLAELPDQMRAELHSWFEVMQHGRTPPRRRPRSDTTIRVNLTWSLPALRTWAANGHTSLREISIDDAHAVLPPSGNPRSTMGQGLKCIFRVLKGLKVVFSDPVARIHTGQHERRQPLPIEPSIIRDALNSPNPARAALAALVAFHGLRAGELRKLHLTDIRDGRLHLQHRTIPLPQPVRIRIAAWLNYRGVRWPSTANPHLFLNSSNAIRLNAPGTRWLDLTLGISTQALREDRILDEVQAANGDVRRVCDLFGLTMGGAARYAQTLEHPGFATVFPTKSQSV